MTMSKLSKIVEISAAMAIMSGTHGEHKFQLSTGMPTPEQAFKLKQIRRGKRRRRAKQEQSK